MATLSSPTLGKLIFNVRNMLGQPNAVNSTWTDAELTEYLNEAVRMYFAEVIANAEGYFTTSTDPGSNLSITSGTETVALPSDFFQAKALYIQRTNGWELLEYRNNVTTGFVSQGGGTGSNTYSPYYYFQGNSIVLHPTPNFTQTGVLRLDYVQFPQTMINGGDALTNQVSPVFKQLIEKYAIVQAKKKQSMVNGTDLTAIAKADLSEAYISFKNAINKRSIAPEYVVPFNPEGDMY
jgi:hypothetical protein